LQDVQLHYLGEISLGHVSPSTGQNPGSLDPQLYSSRSSTPLHSQDLLKPHDPWLCYCKAAT